MEGRGIFWDERENQGEIGPRWALQSVLEGGNENSLGQIPRETSDYWTSNRTVRHTLAHTHKRWRRMVDFLEDARVASDIIGLLMNLSETAISLHRTGRSISISVQGKTNSNACPRRWTWINVISDGQWLAVNVNLIATIINILS